MAKRIPTKLMPHFLRPTEATLGIRQQMKRQGTTFNERLKASREAPQKGEKALPRLPQAKGRPQPISERHAVRLAKYAPHIQQSAIRHNVPIELICGVILQESGGNARAVSHTGAKGLMQLMPATAKRMGVHNSLDPAQNIEGGTKYLRFLLDRFNGNVELALAGYNAGEGNVEKYGNKIPPFRETQNYVPSVINYCHAMINILREPNAPVTAALQSNPTDKKLG